MTLNPEIIIIDTDFRGEQYFLRLYYTFPMQNTSNNMKEVKKEILEAIKIKNKIDPMKIHLEKRIADLGKRLDLWTNHSQAGQSAYSMVTRELEVYQEILKMLDDTSSKPSTEKSE